MIAEGGYTPEQVYNVDETGIFWKCMPARTSIFSGEKSAPVFNDKLWTRKDRINEFDITIGASDSAQVTDLVGIYLMHKLGDEFPGGGVYRDDALLIYFFRYPFVPNPCIPPMYNLPFKCHIKGSNV